MHGLVADPHGMAAVGVELGQAAAVVAGRRAGIGVHRRAVADGDLRAGTEEQRLCRTGSHGKSPLG